MGGSNTDQSRETIYHTNTRTTLATLAALAALATVHRSWKHYRVFKSTLRLFKPEVLQRISFDDGLDALCKTARYGKKELTQSIFRSLLEVAR